MPPSDAPPGPSADRPLFRREAELFRQQRHLGTIILYRPVAIRLLALFPLAVVALLVVGASQLTLQQRFAGVIEPDQSSGRTTVVVEAGAASALEVNDRVSLEVPAHAAAGATRLQGRIATMLTDDCQTRPHAALRFGASSGHRRCLALGLELETPLPPQRAPLSVEVWAPAESYLSYVFDR